MKIKTRLQINTFLSIFVALLVGSVLFWATTQINEEVRQSKVIHDIVNQMSELDNLSHEYSLHHTQRARTQWETKYESLSRLLTVIEIKSPDQKVILMRIQRNHENVKSIFNQLIQTHKIYKKKEGLDQEYIALYQEFENRLTGQLVMNLEGIVFDSNQLSQASHARIMKAQNRSVWLIIIFIMILTACIGTMSFFLNRSIVKPISKLQEGTKYLGAGNLDFKVETISKNEIGDLSRAFNQMVEKLKTITVSRDKLAKEITERKHAESELKKSTRELNFQKFALDEHAILSATDAEGNITYANDKFCEISGYTRDELMGKNHRMIKSDEHSPELFRDMWHTISNGKVWHGEVKNRKKNGDYYWVKATIVPFIDKNGKPHQYIAIRTEITERKKAEKELNKYASQMEQLAEERSKQLVHADRMVTLGTLSAEVAHEVNNPVGFISSNLQIFEKLWDKTMRAYLEKANRENEDKNLSFVLDEMPGMIKAMREGTKRIANIVHRLGRFSRQTKPVFETSNICEVIEAAVNFCRLDLTVKHQVKIQLDLPSDIPNIKISRQEIEQVLINLITNSGHAMEGITDRKELILKIAASHVSNNIVIEITDNGCGMDETTLTNIFSPFFTTKDVGKGTGLGLSICRGILEQHRGVITATSTLGKGTTFTIKLPIDPEVEERREKNSKKS